MTLFYVQILKMSDKSEYSSEGEESIIKKAKSEVIIRKKKWVENTIY